MIARLRTAGWWGAICLLAVVTVFLQFDMESARTPWLAEKVPALFQSRAATTLAQRAIEDQNWSASEGFAARTLRRRPVPASSLSNLALARSQGGTVYDRTVITPMVEAAARGWRDPLAQVAAIAFALDVGKARIAAQRIDALWRGRAMNPGVQMAMQTALADPAVRDALASRYAAGVGWSASFVVWGADNLPPDQFADFLAKAAAKGAVTDCAAMSRAATRMLLGGQPDGAVRIWTSLCGRSFPEHASGLIPLQPPAAITGLFDWSYPAGSGLDRVIQGAGRVQYRGYDLVRGRLARRYAYLTPGDHVLSADIRGIAPVLTVSCIVNGRPTRSTPVNFVSGKARFTLPDRDCAVQQLQLEVVRGEGSIGSVSLN